MCSSLVSWPLWQNAGFLQGGCRHQFICSLKRLSLRQRRVKKNCLASGVWASGSQEAPGSQRNQALCKADLARPERPQPGHRRDQGGLWEVQGRGHVIPRLRWRHYVRAEHSLKSRQVALENPSSLQLCCFFSYSNLDSGKKKVSWKPKYILCSSHPLGRENKKYGYLGSML